MLKRALRWLALVVILGFLAVTFTEALDSAWERLQERPIEFSWHLVLALALFVLAVPLSGVLWAEILRDLGEAQVGRKAGALAHVKSWLLKYIPGQVGSLAYKLYWGKQQGIRAGRIVVSYFYENAFLQIASLVPAVAVLLIVHPLEGDAERLVVGVSAVAAVGFIFLISSMHSEGLGLALLRKLGGAQKPDFRFLSAGRSVRFSAFFIAPRILNGAGFVLIAANLAPVAPENWLVLASAYVLAGAIGILAIFVPSGLGVREAVLVILASQVLGTETAIVAAVLARFLTLLADAMLFAWALLTGLLRIGRYE